MRVLSIMVRHGTEKYPRALDDLRSFHRTRLPAARCDLVVVDNAPDAPTRPADPEIIRGSDSAWEFSAWDEGLAHVGSRVRDYDLVHLVTSAFRTLYARYVDRCDERALALVLGQRVAVGHIDYYDEPVDLLGNRSRWWLRTSFLFLPPSELATLGSLAAITDRAAFFTGDAAHPFLPDAPISESYRRYLLGWLTGSGTGQGTQWHSRFALTQQTLPIFEAKALAILNEHMLAIRLRAQGCALADATWLATRARQHVWRWPRRRLVIPRWTRQLAQRDSDAIEVDTRAE